MKAIWILGATGRTGRAVSTRLVAEGQSVVLVGRNAGQLAQEAARLGVRAAIKVLTSLPDIVQAISRERPAVVVNMIGPFTHTALPIARACPPGTHYADLSNELPSFLSLLAIHEKTAEAGSTFVTGVGSGVLATESIVLRLCKGHPPAARVRCAAIPAVASEPGLLGEALAASITEGLAFGGRRYEAGRLVKTPLLGDFETVSLPDGRVVGTAGAPSGDLEAAKRASGAAFAVSATSMMPSSALVRAMLPTVLTVMKIPAVRRFASRKIAAIEFKEAPVAVPQVSWGYARVEWSSGEKREGWMRTGDAMIFTVEVVTRVAIRLLSGMATPGVYTPGALFGSDLANECGGDITIGPEKK